MRLLGNKKMYQQIVDGVDVASIGPITSPEPRWGTAPRRIGIANPSSGGEAERYALCCAGRNLPRYFSSIAVQQTRA